MPQELQRELEELRHEISPIATALKHARAEMALRQAEKKERADRRRRARERALPRMYPPSLPSSYERSANLRFDAKTTLLSEEDLLKEETMREEMLRASTV
uniref:Uncharacterized protein n=1 Tax=Haptolina brevifila TaxID=156173 RepID=A0A7S2D069_9EUKA|mmetsp:Transcript_31128/g.62314  ORF Transcript_31128/g.62314 Transcript_31128/m.62314 type:complete len:101 (+) Transcript_31128:26-328(+)